MCSAAQTSTPNVAHNLHPSRQFLSAACHGLSYGAAMKLNIIPVPWTAHQLTKSVVAKKVKEADGKKYPKNVLGVVLLRMRYQSLLMCSNPPLALLQIKHRVFPRTNPLNPRPPRSTLFSTQTVPFKLVNLLLLHRMRFNIPDLRFWIFAMRQFPQSMAYFIRVI